MQESMFPLAVLRICWNPSLKSSNYPIVSRRSSALPKIEPTRQGRVRGDSNPGHGSAGRATKALTLLAILVLATAYLPIAQAQSNSLLATVTVGNGPYGAAYDSGKGEVFVTDSAGYLTTNSTAYIVSIISDTTDKVVANVSVAKDPYGVAYDSAKGEVFVTSVHGDEVFVISDATNKVVATVPVGTAPYGIAYDSNKGELFVTNNDNDTVSVISDASNKVVATVPVPDGPEGVAYDSAKGEVFVTKS